MNISILKKIGLNEKEIKAYLALLEHGSSSVRSLAEITGINRGTLYDILKQLQEKGVVAYFHKDTKQKFTAEDPEKILSYFQQQENNFKKTKEEIKSIIPELRSLQDKGGNLPTTKYYEGKKGIRVILEDLLQSIPVSGQAEYYAYSAKEASEDINEAYPEFTRDRIKKGIKVKAISLAEGGKTSGLDERRWLGTNEKTATFILIYAGKCAFISSDSKGEPIGVIIENKMIYETQKIIFLQLWELLNR